MECRRKIQSEWWRSLPSRQGQLIARGEAGRSAGRAGDEVRTGHQPDHCTGARSQDAVVAARPRRRGDRITAPFAAVLPDTYRQIHLHRADSQGREARRPAAAYGTSAGSWKPRLFTCRKKRPEPPEAKSGRIIWPNWHVWGLDGRERSDAHFAGIVRLTDEYESAQQRSAYVPAFAFTRLFERLLVTASSCPKVASALLS